MANSWLYTIYGQLNAFMYSGHALINEIWLIFANEATATNLSLTRLCYCLLMNGSLSPCSGSG